MIYRRMRHWRINRRPSFVDNRISVRPALPNNNNNNNNEVVVVEEGDEEDIVEGGDPMVEVEVVVVVEREAIALSMKE